MKRGDPPLTPSSNFPNSFGSFFVVSFPRKKGRSQENAAKCLKKNEGRDFSSSGYISMGLSAFTDPP